MLKKLAVDALKMLFLHPVALVWNTIKVIIVFLLLSTGVESLCNITLPYMQSLRQCFTWYSPDLKELTISSSDNTKETNEPSALSLTKSFTLPGSHVANEFKSPVNHELYQLSNLVATHPEIYQDPLMRDLFKIQAAQLYFNSQYYPQNANANLDLTQSLPEVYDLPKLPHSLPEAPLTTHDNADKYLELEQANVLNSATNNLQNLSVLDRLINGSSLAKSTPQPNTALTPKLNEIATMISKQKREGDNAHVSLNHHKQAHYLAARPVEEEEEEEQTTPNKSEEHIISLRELEDKNSLEHLRSLEGSALCDFDKKPWSYLDLELEDPLENLSATDLAKFDQVQEALDLLYEHFGALDSHDLELVFTLYAPEKVLLTLERNEIRTQLLAQRRNCPNQNTDSTKLVAPQLQLSSQPPILATKTVSTKPPEHAPSVDPTPPHGLKNSLETKGATITTSNSHYVAASSSAKHSSIPHSTLAAPTNSLEHLRVTTNTSSAPTRAQEQNHIQTCLPKPQIKIVLHSPELINTSSVLNNKDPSTTTTTLAQISQVLSAAQQFMQGLSDLSALASLTELTPSTNNHNTISEHDVMALTTDSSALKDSSLTTSAPLTPGLPIAPAPGQEKLDLSTLSTATNQQLALSTATACTLSSTKDHAPNLFVIHNTKTSTSTSAAPLNATSSQLVFHTLPPSPGGPLNDKVLIATLPNYEDNSLLRPTYIEEEEEEEEEELVNSTPTTILVAANKTKSQILNKASTSKVNTNNESLMPTQILESMNNLASYHASTRAHTSNWQSTSKEISKNGTSISAPEILERKSTLTNCSLSSPNLANTQYLSSNNAREPQMPTIDPSPMNLSNHKDNSIHNQLDSVSADPAQVAQDLYEYFVALQDHQLMNKPLEQVRQNALYLTALINAPEDLLPHCPGQQLNTSELKDQAYRQALIYRRFLEQTLSQRAQLLSKTNVQLTLSNQPTKHLPHKPLILSSSPSMPDTHIAAQLPSGDTTVDSAHELAPIVAINSNTSMPDTTVAVQPALVTDVASKEINSVSATQDIGDMSEVVSNDSTTLVSLPTNLEGLRLGEQRPLSLGNLNLSANTSLSDQELLGRPFFKSEDLDLALRQALHLPKEQATTSLLRSLGISDNASQGSQFSSTNESTLDNYQEQLKTLAQGLTYNEQALKQDQERALHMLMTNSALLQERQLISSDLLSQLQSSLGTLDLVPLAIITEIVAHAHHLGDYSPEQQEQLTVLANFVLNSPNHQRHNYLSLAMLKRYQQICLSYGFKAIYHQAPLLFYQAASLQAV